jgi:hypothetical protein
LAKAPAAAAVDAGAGAPASLEPEPGPASFALPLEPLDPHAPIGYPALIQFWRIVASAAGRTIPGGIGDAAFIMRESESCASFSEGISCEGAVKSAYVTSPARALGNGGSEWHALQLVASIVATSQGTPLAAPPSGEGTWPAPAAVSGGGAVDAVAVGAAPVEAALVALGYAAELAPTVYGSGEAEAGLAPETTMTCGSVEPPQAAAAVAIQHRAA